MSGRRLVDGERRIFGTTIFAGFLIAAASYFVDGQPGDSRIVEVWWANFIGLRNYLRNGIVITV